MLKNLSEKAKKRLAFFLKILFAILAIYIIVTKSDLKEVWHYIKSVPFYLILIAFVILNTGQIISAFRMRFYFAEAGLKLNKKFALVLYFVGNFFNLFLPGGIGGDGYKAYLIKKYHNLSIATNVRLILSNRASGLLLLILITIFMAFFSEGIKERIPYFAWVVISFGLITAISYSVIAKFFLKEKLSTQAKAAIYSFFVQIIVVITAYFLLLGVDTSGRIIDYLVLFMLSSIASVLPISIGGIGLREVAFVKAAPLLSLDAELGVAICVIYFFINSLSSFVGVFLMGKLKKMK